jgi:hypothetical protein
MADAGVKLGLCVSKDFKNWVVAFSGGAGATLLTH